VQAGDRRVAHILQLHVALGNGINQFGNADFGGA